MAQTKVLLDSNSYFRLAKSIHPLLFVEFGNEHYCLYVLAELEDEYERNSRLQTKFAWVSDPEYKENRTKRLTISRKQESERKTVYDFMWDHVQTKLPGPSRLDVVHLSYGYVLGVTIVTDDSDMATLAKVFGVKTTKTLELLKLMLDCGHIDMSIIRRIAAYWSYEEDRPKDFVTDYQRLLLEAPPP
jgi:hypothetical protein